jgi:hypothetical protein
VFLITLLYGNFFSICLAIESATNAALNSGFLISFISIANFKLNSFFNHSSNLTKFSQFFQKIKATFDV